MCRQLLIDTAQREERINERFLFFVDSCPRKGVELGRGCGRNGGGEEGGSDTVTVLIARVQLE